MFTESPCTHCIMLTNMKDDMYREWGWELFTALRANHSMFHSKDNRAPLDNVMMHQSEPTDDTDNMSVTRTLKFLYLLFAPTELSLDRVVFSSVGHIFPKLKLSRGLKTGWKRRAKR